MTNRQGAGGRRTASMWPERLVFGVVVLAVASGAVASASGSDEAAGWLWAAAVLIAGVPASASVIADIARRRYGADLLAVVALIATVAVGEFLAGAVVALMVATGQLLESIARRRAGRDLSALLQRMPAVAHRRDGAEVHTIAASEITPGDRLLILPAEVVPVDGRLAEDGEFDESAVTGESAVVGRAAGESVRSGVTNAGSSVELIAETGVDSSTYAAVLRLAEQASAESAPVARLADRVAVWFLPLALLTASAAWVLSGDPVRGVAVLVTATPCPLLLAVPIAVTAGMSRMARAGVIVKDGAAVEKLGRSRSLVLDKTGTVTRGRPEVVDVICAPELSAEQALSLASAIEQHSTHVLAGSVVRAARGAGVEIPSAQFVREQPGQGVNGTVGSRRVTVGRIGDDQNLPAWAAQAVRRAQLSLATAVWLVIDGAVAAALLIRDPIRFDAPRTMSRLRSAGVAHIVLLTGDRADNASDVAAALGLRSVQARATPADKIARIEAERRDGITVMVGDGINDAPALAAADVGVALGSRGSTAAAQAADAVIVDDRIDRLADAMEIARRTRRLAVASAVCGMTLSAAAMAMAAVGVLTPIAGAVVQEGIDVVVILNALRALSQPALRRRLPERAQALVQRFAAEHRLLTTTRIAVRHAADLLAREPGPVAYAAARRAAELLDRDLLPHERAEEELLYPAVRSFTRDTEATMTMSRGHVEIERLCQHLQRLLDEPDDVLTDNAADLLATLYGLDAVLALHFAQEEEAYFTLARTSDPPTAAGQPEHGARSTAHTDEPSQAPCDHQGEPDTCDAAQVPGAGHGEDHDRSPRPG